MRPTNGGWTTPFAPGSFGSIGRATRRVPKAARVDPPPEADRPIEGLRRRARGAGTGRGALRGGLERGRFSYGALAGAGRQGLGDALAVALKAGESARKPGSKSGPEWEQLVCVALADAGLLPDRRRGDGS